MQEQDRRCLARALFDVMEAQFLAIAAVDLGVVRSEGVTAQTLEPRVGRAQDFS